MRIGFTGTRKGMTEAQISQFASVFEWLIDQGWVVKEFHHCAATGADTQAGNIAKRWRDCTVVVHPANGHPLARNRAIVAAYDILIAAPESDREELRSGTWATIRYARQKGIPIVMLSRGGK